MNNKTLLMSIVFIIILISITLLLHSKYEVDDSINLSSKGVNLKK